MKKLLLLLILSASFASAQITELTYTRPVSNTDSGILNVDQVPYELFGEPDLLWGDVVRRHYTDTREITNQLFVPQLIEQNGRTITGSIIMNGLQPRQYFIQYSKEGEVVFNRETLMFEGITIIEMTKSGNMYSAEFTLPSAGVWNVQYSSRSFDNSQSAYGPQQFTVE